MTELEKHCTMCDKKGHTYIDCPTVSFTSLFQCAMGVEPMFGPSSKETLDGLSEIEKQKYDIEESP